MAAVPQILTYEGVPVWRHALLVRWAAQIVSGIVMVALVIWFFANITNAIQERDIPHGFSFLSRAYQTPIGDHTILPYESSDTFLYALAVGITNTLLVAVAGVVLATLLGIFIGVSRLSTNWIVSRLATVYIEFFRNVPLLVQLLFWFFVFLALPPVREGYVIAGGTYVNNRGISLPWPHASDVGDAGIWAAVAVAGLVAGLLVNKWLNLREAMTGKPSYPLLLGWTVAIGVGAGAWLALSFVTGETPFFISTPEPHGRFGTIAGGLTIKAGLIVLLIGLVMYTAAFIAEIVRAGIQSVGRGQTEAARALGLSPIAALRTVIFPLAMRVVIPPWINQCLNLTKNSSLGGAVGYADLTNIALTMTQTAPAVSIFLLIMAAYLAMSLTWSLAGNLYNRRIQLGRR